MSDCAIQRCSMPRASRFGGHTDAWGKLSKQQRDMYRSKALTVLEAARKAVMGNE